ncbi:peptidoglycan recognition protein [Streptomyces chitinivorans]|uniref:Peptidoglycan recognition protein n=2 Tax=Streptomyces TaxID=1883 RepID=A0ABW7HSY3_9ACTN|nr:N-acetylmuramoyl-L-alanine amidase [Streptomyces chitinivorans]MDH2411328.1 N-acetylmuramoyl-L-alanine amidase [Streptomyces chitinivorans]
MRAFIASSIGVACAAAAVLPLTAPGGLANSASAAPAPASESVAAPRLPGSTQSLPLVPLTPPPTTTPPGSSDSVSLGLPAREVEPFSLLGVVWDDPEEELHGRIQVRTKSAATGEWSSWQDLETHADRPDPDSAESRGDEVRGATAPLWVGDSNGVQARVLPEEGASGAHRLPEGLRLDLVHPGDDPAAESGKEDPAGEANSALAPAGALEIPALDRQGAGEDLLAVRASGQAGQAGRSEATADAPIGPRPGIVTRKGWGADERLRGPFLYTKTVRMAFVHHTAMSNNYSCGQSASIIRGIYRYHVQSNGWRDVGYNFFVDKCGKIYEGRAGGVANPVMGAHTYGFNHDSTGIAVLGSYNSTNPSTAAVDAVSKLVAWKLGLHGVDPRGTATMTSGGGKYPKGTTVRLRTVSGHRDGYVTGCPGDRLYSRLGTIRATAARLQGR